jgi:YVTN family beta-propeller protein
VVQQVAGALTFLFTDIEASTRLLKQLRDRYGAVLEEHQHLLRAAFAAHGGQEVDTQGDSFFVVFSRARDAVLAAVEGQVALLGHEWPEGGAVRVRMGVHTGQAVASDGRYTGVAVHRAARIAAAAHGGQVLVSQATQTLIEDEEEDLRIFLRDLGEQQLKDLDRPVRLYQVTGPDLPSVFPPLRHEAHLARSAETAIRAPVWRRPAVVAGAALGVLAIAAAALVLAMTRSGSGLSRVGVNAVGVIDPQTNRLVDQVPNVGIRPGPIAADKSALWVGNLDDRTLTRIDAVERTVTANIPLENRTPTGLAVYRGDVWVAHGRLGTLSHVEPQFKVVTKIRVADRSAEGAVAVGGGSVWAVYGDSTLARIDPGSNRVIAKTYAGDRPAGIAYGERGVWVVNGGEASVSQFNPETFESGPLRNPITVGRNPTAVVTGDDAVWVAATGDDAVFRIDPATRSQSQIPVGDAPSSLAVGAGGVWVANSGDGTVSRIDPATNGVVKTIDVGNVPTGVAVDRGLVWVTVEAP